MQVWVLHDEVGETYLHRAAREGERDVVLYCLKFDGFHPRCTNKRGFTPLHEACKGGSLEVAKLLLDYGAYHSQPARGNIRYNCYFVHIFAHGLTIPLVQHCYF